jgi:hypothetical protein
LLSAVVEEDFLHLVTEFREFIELEDQERNFLENWLLARFAMLTALRISFTRQRGYRRWVPWAGFLSIVALSISIVVTLATWNTRLSALAWIESNRLTVTGLWLAAVVFLTGIFPRVFRVLYPRFFAGAILGWSTLLGELGTHRLFAENLATLDVPKRLCNGEMPFFVLPLVLLPFPLYFLYTEAQATLESKGQALWRAIIVLGWAVFLVCLVGSAASIGLEKIVCASPPSHGGHLALFTNGCIISLYFTIVVHLVWGDEGMSATLAHEGRNHQ